VLLLRADRRRWIAIAAVGFATVLAAIPVVLVAIDGRIVSESVVEVSRVAAPLGALGHYVESLLLLRTPSISYPIGTDGPGALELALGAAAMLATLLAALRWWRDPAKRHVLALLAWAWIWFLPISHLVAPVHIFVADRFAYFWLFASCGLVAYAVQTLPARWHTATTALLICVLGIATIRAQSAWTSSVELFSRAFAANPRDPNACENLAIALTDDARAEEALTVLDRGLRAQPGNAHLLARKARVLDLLHRRDEALAVSSAAASTQLASAMWNHAVLLRAAGRADEALAWAALAARRHPEIESYVETYAQLLIDTNRPVQARAFLLTVAVLDPSSRTARRMLGMR